ncbi:MAG: hypothetical protein JXB32_13855, partial [Deltaproteobacteria bacterium]|nr:hypothetical protein [Deltaproteobacteria bacterium]
MSNTIRKPCGEGVHFGTTVGAALRPTGLLATLALAALTAPPARAATYDVGPGQPLAAVGDVPWESLAPGDEVRIHWRAEPYREKLVVAVQATEAQPVVIRGIPNESGELPVLDGQSATTRAALNFWNENRSVIKIGGSNTPDCDQPDCVPSWITLESLDVRSARPPYSFTSSRGGGSYADNAAAIHIEVGRNITIRSCRIHDSGNGLF